MNKLICIIFGHKLHILKHLRGDINHGVRTIYCPRCKNYFIMSDDHHAFLEIKGANFISDLKRLYGEDLGMQKQGPKRIS